ncbi:hypothetical protein [Pseudomonas leptonychotis]|uniref:WYL domain-containing protein n=1 Tax=Pseudomonas leptonychotis TaxID=2448482 RepID=A0A4V4R8K2_9PSED|nr:hypothetical protein [Pseudomonas leptonychotis]TIH10814.1 hypothetical protein D8779_09100 [Pseudomonas leptonychotis]
MDALIALLVLVCIITGFVLMVRRTNAKGRGLEVRQVHRPEPLSKEQRKALNLTARPQAALDKAWKKANKPDATTRTRAIRTGWRMGEVAFTYEDSAGDISHRTVTAHSVTSVYIKGECHDRQAERTFRLDRIIGDLTDCETGEILNPKKWASRHK